MDFPHRRLLRKLRKSARHRGHAPLISVADLPRFTCLDSGILRRLPCSAVRLVLSSWLKLINKMLMISLAVPPKPEINMKRHSVGNIATMSETTNSNLAFLSVTVSLRYKNKDSNTPNP